MRRAFSRARAFLISRSTAIFLRLWVRRCRVLPTCFSCFLFKRLQRRDSVRTSSKRNIYSKLVWRKASRNDASSRSRACTMWSPYANPRTTPALHWKWLDWVTTLINTNQLSALKFQINVVYCTNESEAPTLTAQLQLASANEVCGGVELYMLEPGRPKPLTFDIRGYVTVLHRKNPMNLKGPKLSTT